MLRARARARVCVCVCGGGGGGIRARMFVRVLECGLELFCNTGKHNQAIRLLSVGNDRHCFFYRSQQSI